MKLFAYHSTNCFFLESKKDNGLLAIDAGWPCTLLEYQRGMKSIGLQFRDIKWAIVTHFHIDHAGLISEFQKNGIECFVFENQYDYIYLMEKTITKNYKNYEPILKNNLVKLETDCSKKYFDNLGFDIEIIVTTGHSEDSISIVQNDEIIIGDLTPVHLVMDDDIKSKESWEIIKAKNIRKVYPGHAKIFEL